MKISYKTTLSAQETINLQAMTGEDVKEVEVEVDVPEEYMTIAKVLFDLAPVVKGLLAKFKKPATPVLRVNGVVAPSHEEKAKYDAQKKAEYAEQDVTHWETKVKECSDQEELEQLQQAVYYRDKAREAYSQAVQ